MIISIKLRYDSDNTQCNGSIELYEASDRIYITLDGREIGVDKHELKRAIKALEGE
ncbi:hypothetical protein [Aneurinibacillus migulanus]|uniref:hypothetical protein n=1 Tax=Aneurinibacillus migulanus TaxID=47500 RepID=UPI0020A0022B|nr:hypothetical protein [Aneurinibacillus migulanus]MCP1354596.1 hypothetical protein [Aneurinibacillus migulanus]